MDLRTFIAEIDNRKMLNRIDRPVHWKYEIGRMTRESDGALLFTNVCEYPGQSVFTGGMRSYGLIAVSLGLEPDIPKGRLLKEMKRRLQCPVSPVMVKQAYFDRIISGGAIDLQKFPVPWWSEIDGGRFIGTWHLNVTKSPSTGKRNIGVYRMQVLSPSTASISVSPHSHLKMHMKEAEARNQDLEMAVCIGVSEAAVMAGGAAFPSDVDEYSMAGALNQRPVQLVGCRTIDLEVPADSEIVIEGVLKAGKRVTDGPYLDYAGIPSSNPRAYLFEVKSIMHKKEPVFRGTSVGIPGGEDHQMLAVLAQLDLVDFHGSKVRQKMQNVCLKNRFFSLFQMTGRIGTLIHK